MGLMEDFDTAVPKAELRRAAKKRFSRIGAELLLRHRYSDSIAIRRKRRSSATSKKRVCRSSWAWTATADFWVPFLRPKHSAFGKEGYLRYERHCDGAATVLAGTSIGALVDVAFGVVGAVVCASKEHLGSAVVASVAAMDCAPTARPELVDASVQCSIDDVVPASRPLIRRKIDQLCLHCCKMLGPDKQICGGCAVSTPVDGSHTDAGIHCGLARSLSEPSGTVAASAPPVACLQRTLSERPQCGGQGGSGRRFRSVATSLRPQDVKVLGDASLLSRRVSFAGNDGRKMGSDGRHCLAEDVMCNKGSMEEIIPLEVGAADLEAYSRLRFRKRHNRRVELLAAHVPLLHLWSIKVD